MTGTMNDKILEWMRGDEDATHFAVQMWDALQQWDDIIDEGRCETPNDLMGWLAFGKEYHPFFAKHSPILRPCFLQLYLSWTSANVLERGSRDDVNKAYMLRAGYYQFLQMMAWCVGGERWAVLVGPDIYRYYAETADGLWKEFN